MVAREVKAVHVLLFWALGMSPVVGAAQASPEQDSRAVIPPSEAAPPSSAPSDSVPASSEPSVSPTPTTTEVHPPAEPPPSPVPSDTAEPVQPVQPAEPAPPPPPAPPETTVPSVEPATAAVVIEDPCLEADPNEYPRWPAYALWGASAVTLGVGVYLGVTALEAKQDYNDRPSQRLADRAEDRGLIADVMIGSGIVLAVGGLLHFMYDEPSEVALRSPARAQVVMQPVLHPKLAGASVVGKF